MTVAGLPAVNAVLLLAALALWWWTSWKRSRR
jgi:hypothetical protein